jgi:hypothetical protein
VPVKAVPVSIGIVGVFVAVLSVGTTVAQVDPRMPDGPNRDLVVRICGSCHDLSNLYTTTGRSRERWSRTLDDMVLLGLRVTPQERELILEYLATYLAQ